MAMDMKSHGKCRLTSSDPIPYIRTYSFGLPKNSRHNAIINHELETIIFRPEKKILLRTLKKKFFSPQFGVFAGERPTSFLVKAVHTQHR
jgi:hypothetical protein